MRTSSGSVLVWLFLGGLVALIIIGGLVWGKLFLTTSGIDTPQINNYQKVTDEAKQLQENAKSSRTDIDMYNR